MALETQDIRLRSATTVESAPSARSFRPEVAKLIDLSRCIGCKACQAACMEWNDLREPVGTFQGTYTNPLDLSDQSWTVMKFNETEVDGQLAWFIFKDGCMHCTDPGCLKACPAPGAVVQYANGIVDFQQDELHRVRLLHHRLPVRHPPASARRTAASTSARSARTGSRWGSSRPASSPARPRRSASGRRRR